MRSSAVVKAEIAPDGSAGFRDAAVGVQKYLLVFNIPPQAFNENVVAPGPSAIHVDLHLPTHNHFDEVGQGKFAALIRIEASLSG